MYWAASAEDSIIHWELLTSNHAIKWTSLARNSAAAAVLCFKTVSHSLLASLDATNTRRKEQHQARQEDDDAGSAECRVVRPCHVWQPAYKQTAVSLAQWPDTRTVLDKRW